ncbi:hypothetical protein LTT66_20795 [Nocardia gipuzkoensis]|uniref:hypothetical protein n=1 Tax=Nocardia gipuzkoensis TaxID=2749991 RepID=UPI001E3E6C19|nr:hypothetical protein [Nocardia gipuzkoensis]UGT65763.1 hypothetical protein LTT66_20795 [Nocardia gipuzkoensis]
MHRSNRAPLFSHPSEPAEVSAPVVGAVRLPVFSDIVAAAPSVATDEAGSAESGGE